MPDIDPPQDDPMVLAGEYALRVLEGGELADAQRRMLADREFAEMVEWWQGWLGNMAEQAPPVEPSARLWQAIEARLFTAGADGSGAVKPGEIPARPGPSGWSMLLAGTGIAALIGAFFLALPGTLEGPAQPEPTAATPSQQLIAQLASEDGAIRLAGRIDPDTQRLVLRTAGFQAPADRAPELWVIPEGGAPVSLGLIPATGRHTRTLTASERAMMVPGATLAVTMENAATAPHDAPTSDVVVAGALDQV